jgi:transposase-like protein
MKNPNCPRCDQNNVTKSGVLNQKQRFKCKDCNYNFTVEKMGKGISTYYVIKALQLYIEGVSYREIERLLGVSHVSVMNWVKKYQIKIPKNSEYYPTYKVMNHKELVAFYSDRENLRDAGMIITELGDKFMLIKWQRLKQ